MSAMMDPTLRLQQHGEHSSQQSPHGQDRGCAHRRHRCPPPQQSRAESRAVAALPPAVTAQSLQLQSSAPELRPH